MMESLARVWNDRDLIWFLSKREIKTLVSKKLFWLAIFTPPLIPLLAIPVVMVVERSKSRDIAIYYEPGLENVSASLKAVFDNTRNEMWKLAKPQVTLTVSGQPENERKRVERSQLIRDNLLMAFIEVSPRKGGGMPEVHLYSEPMNSEMKSIRERLETAVLFLNAEEYSPDLAVPISFDPEVKVFHHIPIRETGGTGANPKEMMIMMTRVMVVILLSMLFNFSLTLSTGPLRSGLCKEKQSGILITLLTSFELHQVVLAKYLTSLLLTGFVLGMYGSVFLVPAVLLGAVSKAYATWFAAFAALTVIMESALAFSIGIIARDEKDGARLSGPFAMLSIFGSMSLLLILQAPNSKIGLYASYVPSIAASLAPARVALLKEVPWIQPAGSLVVLGICALTITWFSLRICTIENLLSDKKFRLRDAIRRQKPLARMPQKV